MPSRDDLLTTDVGRAAEVLRGGGLVAIPTETVYGLAADARQPAAVARIFEVKGRPIGHPLIVHIAGVRRHRRLGRRRRRRDRGRNVARLADACWPGPLTMLVPRGRARDRRRHRRSPNGRPACARPSADAGADRHARDRAGGAVGQSLRARQPDDGAPRARRSRRRCSTRERDAVLDGGPCPVGVESTIVDLTTAPPQVLRAGAIDAGDVESILAAPVADGGRAEPGQRDARRPLRPRQRGRARRRSQAAARVSSHGDSRAASGSRVLDRTDDLVVAARELYADLRQADRDRLDALVVVLPPAAGLGHALRDRLVQGRSRESPIPSQSSELSAATQASRTASTSVGRDAALRPDREPDRRGTGVGQQLEPAPARAPARRARHRAGTADRRRSSRPASWRRRTVPRTTRPAAPRS